MRAIIGVSVVLILAITSVRAERLPNQERVAVGVGVADKTELGKILSAVTYDRGIGKIARIHYYSAKATKLEDARRVYVSVKSNGLSRRAAAQMQESIIRSIVSGTPLMTVGAIDNADTILEVELQPCAAPAGESLRCSAESRFSIEHKEPVMRLARARSTIRSFMGMLAFLAADPSAARSEAPIMRHAAMEESDDLPKTGVTEPALPPRALLRIGTDDLRAPAYIRSFAISPSGGHVAAGDLYPPNTRVTFFDVQTGRRVKQLVGPGNRPGWVDTTTFSPDGTKLLWGELSGAVALWDLSADRLLFHQELRRSNVFDVKFSPDGRLFASSSLEGVIELRRVERPDELVRSFSSPKGGQHLAFTPDGTKLVAGHQFNTIIRVWRLSDGRLLNEIGPTAGDHLSSIAVTSDSRRILSGGVREEEAEAPAKRAEEKAAEVRREIRPGMIEPVRAKEQPTVKRAEIRLWDIDSGERIRDLAGPDEIGFGNVALSPDDRKLAVVDFQHLRMLDASTLKPLWATALPGKLGGRVTISSDGKLVVLAEQNAIAIFDAATGRRRHHDDNTPVGRLGAAEWSRMGDRIVTGHSDGFVRVWDAATGKLIWHKLLAPIVRSGGRSADPTSVGFSRNDKLLLAAGRRDDPSDSAQEILVVYEAAAGEVTREFPRSWFRLAATAPDGRMLVVAHDNCLVGIEPATGRQRWTAPTVTKARVHVDPAALQFEGNSIWFDAALKNGNVIRFNVLTGHEERRFLADGRTAEQQQAARLGNPILATAAFSADGRTMASSFEGWVCVWDVAAGTLRRRILYPHSRDCSLAVAPDGKTIATSDVPREGDQGEDKIRLFDTTTGEEVLTLESRDNRATVLAFSPDGARLLAGFQRGSAVVWDVRRGQVAPREKK